MACRLVVLFFLFAVGVPCLAAQTSDHQRLGVDSLPALRFSAGTVFGFAADRESELWSLNSTDTLWAMLEVGAWFVRTDLAGYFHLPFAPRDLGVSAQPKFAFGDVQVASGFLFSLADWRIRAGVGCSIPTSYWSSHREEVGQLVAGSGYFLPSLDFQFSHILDPIVLTVGCSYAFGLPKPFMSGFSTVPAVISANAGVIHVLNDATSLSVVSTTTWSSGELYQGTSWNPSLVAISSRVDVGIRYADKKTGFLVSVGKRFEDPASLLELSVGFDLTLEGQSP